MVQNGSIERIKLWKSGEMDNPYVEFAEYPCVLIVIPLKCHKCNWSRIGHEYLALLAKGWLCCGLHVFGKKAT